MYSLVKYGFYSFAALLGLSALGVLGLGIGEAIFGHMGVAAGGAVAVGVPIVVRHWSRSNQAG